MLAAVSCGKVQSPTAPQGALPAMQAAPRIEGEPLLVGYARNVAGTIQIRRGEKVIVMSNNVPMYDDD